MKINSFALERYFAKYEFSAPYLLSSSDAEPLQLTELLELASPPTRELWDRLSLGYTESQGHPLLLQEIANLYTEINSSQIIEVVPEEGIFVAMNVLLKPGDHVIVTHPGYQSLYEIARSIGCEVTWWEPDLAGDMSFSVDMLPELIKDNTRLIVMNFPHNPTGALISRAEQQAVIQIAQQRGIFIFSDEMYRYAEMDPADRLPAAADIYEKGISLSGLSKSFSLPGLRVGWLTAQDKGFIDAVTSFKDYTTICASAPSEILAVIALQAKKTILSRNIAILNTNLSVLDDFFAENNHVFRWVRPRGGTIIFPQLLLDQPAEDFCLALMEAKGVMLLPSSLIGCRENHVRIGFGRRNLPAVLPHLSAFIQSL